MQRELLVLQPLNDVTHTEPVVNPALVEIEIADVPCPEMYVVPEGKVQL